MNSEPNLQPLSLQPPSDALAYDDWVTGIVRDENFPCPEGGVWWYEYGVEWPKGSDYEGDGWFIDSRLDRVLEELETAPDDSVLWKRLRVEWRGPEQPPRAWRIVTGPWVLQGVPDDED